MDPNGAHPNGAHPNGAHPNGVHPNSAQQQCPKVPTNANPQMEHLVAPNVLLKKGEKGPGFAFASDRNLEAPKEPFGA